MYIFTLYRTPVIILKTISSTYTHPLDSQTVQKKKKRKKKKKKKKTPREKRSLKRCVFRLFLKGERDGELRTFVGRVSDFRCLKVYSVLWL